MHTANLTMRSPIQAIVWEMWAAHRRAWMAIAAIFCCSAIVFRAAGSVARKSDLLCAICVISAELMLILLMLAINFTEVNSRKGYAGFPQRLFVLPVRTRWLVGWPMVFGVVCVVGIYIAWAVVVLRPLVAGQIDKAAAAGVVNFATIVRWPAVLLATGVVLFQAIVWCLSGFRLARLVVLGFVLTFLAAIGFLPFLPTSVNGTTLRGTWTEGKLTAVLVATMLGAYAASVLVVGRQRCGGEINWAWRREMWQKLANAVPHWQWKLSSPDRALMWMEWRRSGMALPAAVMLLALLILGPVAWLGGESADATMRSIWWLAASPLVLAMLIGGGLAKPDFWSMQLALSPFLSVRPVTSGQIVAAKMKSAAASATVAWAAATVAIAAKAASGDPDHLHDLWMMFCTLYSPAARWAIAILGPIALVLLTWELLVGSLWLGGRPWFYHSVAATAVVLLFAGLIGYAIWGDMISQDGQTFIVALGWIPWLLAATFILKIWARSG